MIHGGGNPEVIDPRAPSWGAARVILKSREGKEGGDPILAQIWDGRLMPKRQYATGSHSPQEKDLSGGV